MKYLLVSLPMQRISLTKINVSKYQQRETGQVSLTILPLLKHNYF